MSRKDAPGNYRDFWPAYVREHRRPATRALHFVGTTGALACGVLALALGEVWPVPLGLVLGYGCAWIGHLEVEKNRPATFRHPLWSFAADLRMYGLMWAGRMEAEVEHLTSADDAPRPAAPAESRTSTEKHRGPGG